jgi:hypothetical protein
MFRLVLAGLLLWSVCIPGSAAGAGQDYVVTVVTGTAASGGNALRFMDQLAPGRSIALEQGAQLVVFRFRGALEYTLSGPGSFAVHDSGIVRTSASGTLQMKRMDPAFSGAAPSAGKLAQAGVTMRSGATIARDSPWNGDKVLPGAPVFRWSERPHVGDYAFLLADAGDRILLDTQQAGTELALPDVRLAPGASYRWELAWRDPAGQMRMAMVRFGTLPAADAATLERLRPPPGAAGSAGVLFGLWLRSVGALSLAEPYLAEPRPVP